MNVREDIWKLVGLVLFVCSGLAGHYDVLPAALEPYKEWIEFVGFVGGLVNAWRMSPLAKTSAPAPPVPPSNPAGEGEDE